MASILKVDRLDPQSGTALEIGTSGDTISVPSGATLDISSATLTPPATMPASSGVNLTALNATNLGSGTVPTARLGTGTASSSTFLRGDQTYAAAGGGKIGQVIESGSSPNATTISSSTFTQLTDGSTALVASITPSATSSSVLMQVVINARCENSRGYGVSLRRAGVQFFASATAYDVYDESNDGDDVDRSVWFDIDTGISTTSATEYSVYVKTESGNAVVFQYGNDGSKILLWEILA